MWHHLRAKESGLIESFKTDDPHVALTCHHGGGSLYFRSSQEMADRLVLAVARELGMNFGALQPTGEPQGEIETFVSRKGVCMLLSDILFAECWLGVQREREKGRERQMRRERERKRDQGEGKN